MEIVFTEDMGEAVRGATVKFSNLRPSLSDEQIEVVLELLTAECWAGYVRGYEDAKQGKSSAVARLASIPSQD